MPPTATTLALAAALCATTAAWAQQTGERKGTRVNLSVGQLFIPEGYRPTADAVHLVVHLHGSAKVAEENLVRSGWDAVLVTVVLNGLSAVYAAQFAKPEAFAALLEEVPQQLRKLGVAEAPRIARVTVTSFSAGFGGVRELLKSEDLYQRIDTLAMADSIHTGFAGAPALRRVDPGAMAGFLRFARDAAEGKKTLVLSHSQIKPETYASTTETADYLLAQLGGQREAVDEEWAEGLRCTSRFGRGRLSVFGFAGDTGPAHMKHLHYLWKLLAAAGDSQ
jgi:hypothetical protein